MAEAEREAEEQRRRADEAEARLHALEGEVGLAVKAASDRSLRSCIGCGTRDTHARVGKIRALDLFCIAGIWTNAVDQRICEACEALTMEELQRRIPVKPHRLTAAQTEDLVKQLLKQHSIRWRHLKDRELKV